MSYPPSGQKKGQKKGSGVFCKHERFFQDIALNFSRAGHRPVLNELAATRDFKAREVRRTETGQQATAQEIIDFCRQQDYRVFYDVEEDTVEVIQILHKDDTAEFYQEKEQ